MISQGVTASISGLIIERGKMDEGGAGILNNGVLNLTNCTVTANKSNSRFAGGGNGGGIENLGTANLTNCTVSDNNGDFGGGIKNDAGADQ